VLGVFFFHLDWEWMSGGWLGVDVFFVISGYLISSILLREVEESGKVSLSQFYLRRVRRIMPALLVSLIGTFLIALIFSDTSFFNEYLNSLLSALFSVSNVFFWQHSGYFAIDSHLVPLLHTWTLGVEEQFYIIIPALFAFFATRSARGRRGIWFGIFLSTIGSFFLCRYGQGVLSDGFRFYMLPTRMWELAIGTFLALLLTKYPGIRGRSFLHQVFGVLSLGVLIYAFSHYVGNSNFAEKCLFTVLATAVLIICANEGTIVGRLFSLPPLRFVGKISYSMYLWHWPLIVLLHIQAFRMESGVTVTNQLAVLAAVFVISTLSWKYVEEPFRRKRTWKQCLASLSLPASIVAACILIGFTSFRGEGEKYTYNLEQYHEARFESARKERYPALGPNGVPQFMVIGDSHARATGFAFQDLADEYGISGVIGTHSATAPLVNIRASRRVGDPPFVKTWMDYIEKHQIKHVVMVAKWDSLYSLETRVHLQREKMTHELAQEELRSVVNDLIEQGRHVWILDQIPRFKKDPRLAVRLISDDYCEDVSGRDTVYFASKALNGIESDKLHLMDAMPYLIQSNVLSPVRDNVFLYKDKSHLTPEGSRYIKDVFRPLFEAMSS